MVIEIKRKERETMGAFVRRFSRRIQQSGILLRARKSRFFERPPTKRQKKLSALRREELRKYYERLKKLGKLEE